jgi:hypothetical protein
LERIVRAHVVEDAKTVKAVEETEVAILKNNEQQEQVGWRDTWSKKPGKKASAEGESFITTITHGTIWWSNRF